MTKRELSKYYYLSLEMKNIENRIRELEITTISCKEPTGMPRGNEIGKPVEKKAELLIRLKEKLEKRKEKSLKILSDIDEYIEAIEDPETRMIFTKRYIELKRWEDITKEMCMSESSVFRRHKNQLRRNQDEVV